VLSLRIVLAWFAPQGFGRAWDVLKKITDPYLAVFYRIGFLRKGIFDFTPIAAVLVLVVAFDLVYGLSNTRFTLGVFLASVVTAAWSGVSFLLIFFLVIGAIRMIPIFFRGTQGATLWKVVDMIIQPVVTFVARLLRLGARSGYTQYLLFTMALLLIVLLFGGLVVVPNLVLLIQLIPI
jgi:YggT family protein